MAARPEVRPFASHPSDHPLAASETSDRFSSKGRDPCSVDEAVGIPYWDFLVSKLGKKSNLLVPVKR